MSCVAHKWVTTSVATFWALPLQQKSALCFFSSFFINWHDVFENLMTFVAFFVDTTKSCTKTILLMTALSNELQCAFNLRPKEIVTASDII